jgi:hypothetical protein
MHGQQCINQVSSLVDQALSAASPACRPPPVDVIDPVLIVWGCKLVPGFSFANSFPNLLLLRSGLNGGGSWSALQGGGAWSLPPGCIPSNGGCNSAHGQFAVKTDLLSITVEGFLRCYCPEAQTQGHVIKQLPDGKLGCVPGAVFIPDSPVLPHGNGVWVDDVFNQNAPPACNGSQACWDMCFW